MKHARETVYALLESAPDATVVIDADGLITHTNELFEKLFGYAEAELTGRPVEALMPERFRPQHEVLREEYQLMPSRRPMASGSTFYALHKDGREFPVEISLSPLQTVEGNRVLASIRDVSDRMDAARREKWSEQRYRKIFDGSNDAILLIDPDQDRIVEANRAAARMLGYTPQELLQITPSQLHRKDPDSLRHFIQGVQEQGSGWSEHLTCETASGTLLSVEVSSSALPLGDRQLVLCMVRDISSQLRTEKRLQESEARFRSLFENAVEAIVVMDVDTGRFLTGNPQALSLFGLSLEELTGVGPVEMSPPVQPDGRSSPEAAKELIQTALRGKTPFCDWVHCNARGEEIHCELRLTQMPDRDRILVRASIVDITRRKEAEDRIRFSYEQIRNMANQVAEAEEREKSRLARELHDQVGQTLTALGININFILDSVHPGTPLSKAVIERLTDAAGQVETMGDSVRGVMTELRPAVLDDYGLQAALRWYGELYQKRTRIPVRLSGFQPDARFPPDVETVLFRIALEALNNVAKYARADQVSIELTTVADGSHFCIRDDGIGFDAETVVSDQKPGHWGLTIMRERAISVGAAVEITSSLGSGTAINVLVPKNGCEAAAAVKRRVPSGKGSKG